MNDYFRNFIANRWDKGKYAFIHTLLYLDAQYEKQGDCLVVDTKTLFAKQSLVVELRKIESELYNSAQMFDKNGYIVLNIQKEESIYS